MTVVETKLHQLELSARQRRLLLRLQVRRPLGLWALRLVVAQHISDDCLQILGEMKAWAYGARNGLQLDTMRVKLGSPAGVGNLIWAATMSWALESTPCRQARLLAICDDEYQHRRLVRYFKQRGFSRLHVLGGSLTDLPLRLVWGGTGELMCGDCHHVLAISERRWYNHLSAA
ncbi:hypothetical protein OMCYN_01027 [cyanobiont of Ornithocercus magnificus]|nr:hypothetical protein OMCYN_01027 [cyanobiont of Ornithocercus magnificus]